MESFFKQNINVIIEISCFALIFISTLVSFHIHNLILELVLVVVGENFIKHDMDRVNRESNNPSITLHSEAREVEYVSYGDGILL